MSNERVAELLSATLQNDNALRKRAEAELAVLSKASGYLYTLIQLVAGPSITPLGKVAAAIALKNAIERNWYNDRGEQQSDAAVYSEQEKAFIRPLLLEGAASGLQPAAMRALCEAARHVFTHDYPDRWQALPEQALQLIRSGDINRAFVVCTALAGMFKAYQWRPEEATGPPAMLLEAIWPSLATLANELLARHSDSPEAGAVVVKILKIFHAATRNHLRVMRVLVPPFTSPPTPPTALLSWWGFCGRVLANRLRGPGEPGGMPGETSARDKWPWWGAKKWAMKIFSHTADVNGRFSLEEEGSPMRPVSEIFNKSVAPVVCGGCLEMIAAAAAARSYTPPVMSFYMLAFLQTVVDFASCWKMLKPHVASLLGGYVLPTIRLSPSELELIRDDPHEYMRLSSDFITEATTPRYAAGMLLSALLSNRAEAAVAPLDALMEGAIAAYPAAVAAALASGAATDAKSALAVPTVLEAAINKEGALYILQLVSAFYRQDPKHTKILRSILADHVTPEFASPAPYLRSRACAVWGNFIDLKGPAPFQTAVRSATGAVIQLLLHDPSPLVAFTAGSTLRFFLEGSPIAQSTARPHVIKILTRLFAMIDDFGLDEVVATVQSIAEVFNADMPTLAEPMVVKMIELWRGCVAMADAEGEIEDEEALAAGGLVQAIRAVLNVLILDDHTAVAKSLLKHLFPFVADIFAVPDMEFLDEGLPLFGDMISLLEHEVANVPDAWALLERQFAIFEAAAIDFLDEMFFSITNMMNGGMDRFAAEPARASPSPAAAAAATAAASSGPVPPHEAAEISAEALDSAAPSRDASPALAFSRDYAAMLAHSAEFAEISGDEDARALYGRLVMTFLHFGYGKPIGRVVPRLSRLYLLAMSSAKTRPLRDSAAAVFASCLIHSPVAVLNSLRSFVPYEEEEEEEEEEETAASARGGVVDGIEAALRLWLPLLATLRRSLDAKLCILGLTVLMRLPPQQTPPAVLRCGSLILEAVVAAEIRYELCRVAEAAARKKKDEEGSEDGDEDEGEGGEGDDDIDVDGADADEEEEEEDAAAANGAPTMPNGVAHADDEHDVITEDEKKHAAKLTKLRAEKANGVSSEDAAKASGDEFGADAELWRKPPPDETPIDHIKHVMHLGAALHGLASRPEWAALQGAVSPATRQALMQLYAKATAMGAAGTVMGDFGVGPEEESDDEGERK